MQKYDSAGNLLWSRAGRQNANDMGTAIVFDSSGNIFVLGITENCGTGRGCIVLLKYDAAGTLLWQKIWEGSGRSMGFDIAVDGDVLYIAGAAPNNSGTWRNVSGTMSPPKGTESSPEGVETSPEGTETTPVGMESSPEGVEDSGGGKGDVLIMKYTPP